MQRIPMKLAAVAVLVFGAASAGAGTADMALEDLAWMAGHWKAKAGAAEVEELWLAPKGDMMLGLNRSVAPEGATFFEFLRIVRSPQGIVYLGSPGGRPPTPFVLVEAGERRVVFANPEHDFPQRILYWIEGDALHAKVEGTEGGEPRSEQWRFERAKAEAP